MTAHERLRKIDSLHERVTNKLIARMNKRRLSGKDAAKCVEFRQMLNRIEVLMPFYRVRRHLP